MRYAGLALTARFYRRIRSELLVNLAGNASLSQAIETIQRRSAA